MNTNKNILFPYGVIETDIKKDYSFLKKTLIKDFEECYKTINSNQSLTLKGITTFNRYIKDISNMFYLNNKIFTIDVNINLEIIKTDFYPNSYLFYITDNIKKTLILIIDSENIKIYINKEFYNSFLNKENRKLYSKKYIYCLSKIYKYYNINNFDNISYIENEEILIDTFKDYIINIRTKRNMYINNLEEDIILKKNEYSYFLLYESNIIPLLNNIFHDEDELPF